MSQRYSALNSPLNVRGKMLKSRFEYPVAQPHFLQGPETYPGDPVVAYYTEICRKGSALLIVHDLTNPDQRKMGSDIAHFCMYDLDDYGSQNYFTQFAHFVHCQGSYVGTEICCDLRLPWCVNDPSQPEPERGGPGGPFGPGGPMFEDEYDENLRPVATVKGFPGSPGTQTEYFTKENIQKYIKVLSDRARRFKSFGYDAGMIEMGAEFYFAKFMSKRENRRTDEYGGSFENRSRFAIEVLKGLREGVGEDFIIFANAPDIAFDPSKSRGGEALSIDEAVWLFDQLVPYVDIIRLRGEEKDTGDECECAKLATELKRRGVKQYICINTPYMDLDRINAIVAEGKADMISSARMFICNENLGSILKNGNGEDLNPCIECGVCRGSIGDGDWMSHCTINPELGMEHRKDSLKMPVEKFKKIAVIGGGPAGMKCAMWLKERGHTPVIFEASNALGGQIKTSRYPEFKWKLRRYLDFLIAQLDRKGIEVRLNTLATPEMISSEGFDAVVAALGAEPQKPTVKGAENIRWNAVNIYGNVEQLGQNVVVIGGSSAPCEAAAYLADTGRKVTLLSRKSKPNYDLNPIRTQNSMNMMMLQKGVNVIVKAKATEVGEGYVKYTDRDGTEHTIQCDDVVAAGGMAPNMEAAMKFYGSADEFYAIGDCKEAGNMRTAIRDAYALAMRI